MFGFCYYSRNNKDILSYFSRAHYSKYKISPPYTGPAASYNNVKKIYEQLCFATKLEKHPKLFKDYIDWIFENRSDLLITEIKQLWFNSLCSPRLINDFARQYKSKKVDNVFVEKSGLDISDMEDCYSISGQMLLQRYGHVLSYAFLLKKMKKVDCVSFIMNNCQILKRRI